MATIREVARAAGVSTATVSRVFGNSPLVSHETAKKVLDEEVGYILDMGVNAHFNTYISSMKDFLKKDYDAAYRNIGNIYYLQKKYALSVEYYKKCVDINPESTMTHICLAKAYNSMRDIESSRKHYRIASEKSPKLREQFAALLGNEDKDGQRAADAAQCDMPLWDEGQNVGISAPHEGIVEDLFK